MNKKFYERPVMKVTAPALRCCLLAGSYQGVKTYVNPVQSGMSPLADGDVVPVEGGDTKSFDAPLRF